MNNIKYLEWDSKFFGIDIGRVILTNGNRKIKVGNYDLIYIFTDEKLTTDFLSSIKGDIEVKLVDHKVVYSTNIISNNSELVENHVKAEEEIEIVDVLSTELVDLALQSGIHSRFKDSNLKNGAFERLYRRWIEKSVDGSIADSVFVKKDKSKDVGFVSYKKKEGYGEIGLIAVDSSYRGKSIGKKLINRVKKQVIKDKLSELRVATQMGNTVACSFYEKNGFKIKSKQYIYHVWNEKSNGAI